MLSCGNKILLVSEQPQGTPHDALHHSSVKRRQYDVRDSGWLQFFNKIEMSQKTKYGNEYLNTERK